MLVWAIRPQTLATRTQVQAITGRDTLEAEGGPHWPTSGPGGQARQAPILTAMSGTHMAVRRPKGRLQLKGSAGPNHQVVRDGASHKLTPRLPSQTIAEPVSNIDHFAPWRDDPADQIRRLAIITRLWPVIRFSTRRSHPAGGSKGLQRAGSRRRQPASRQIPVGHFRCMCTSYQKCSRAWFSSMSQIRLNGP